MHWYNHERRHSGIRHASPAQRHAGADTSILAARHELYCQARQRNPRRWSGATRNWTPIEAVTLNPERDCVVKTNSGSLDKTGAGCMNKATNTLTHAAWRRVYRGCASPNPATTSC